MTSLFAPTRTENETCMQVGDPRLKLDGEAQRVRGQEARAAFQTYCEGKNKAAYKRAAKALGCWDQCPFARLW